MRPAYFDDSKTVQYGEMMYSDAHTFIEGCYEALKADGEPLTPEQILQQVRDHALLDIADSLNGLFDYCYENAKEEIEVAKVRGGRTVISKEESE